MDILEVIILIFIGTDLLMILALVMIRDIHYILQPIIHIMLYGLHLKLHSTILVVFNHLVLKLVLDIRFSFMVQKVDHGPKMVRQDLAVKVVILLDIVHRHLMRHGMYALEELEHMHRLNLEAMLMADITEVVLQDQTSMLGVLEKYMAAPVEELLMSA